MQIPDPDTFAFGEEAACRLPVPAAQDGPKLIALIGQSNAGGWTNNGPAPYNPTAQVQILVGDHFETMTPGVNTGTAADAAMWGPEVGIALEWISRSAETLYIVKSTKGETGLAQDPDSLDWSPLSQGELFDIATGKVALAKLITGLQLTHTFIVQGETDASSEATSAVYLDNLELLLNAWGGDETLSITDDSFAWSAAVIAAQRQHEHIEVEHTFSPDNIHYDAVTQLAIGHAFGDVLFGI